MIGESMIAANDTLFTGLSGLIILIIVVWILVRFFSGRGG
jgi:hypothetical protein